MATERDLRVVLGRYSNALEEANRAFIQLSLAGNTLVETISELRGTHPTLFDDKDSDE